MKPVLFDAEAEAEIENAAAWYLERDPDLPAFVLAEISQVTTQIASLPLRFPALSRPAHEPPVRRARLRRFPFALLFIDLDDHVRIVAFAHARRRQLYWRQRLAPTK